MTGLSYALHRVFICVSLNGVSDLTNNQKAVMKIKMIVCSALAAALLAGCCTEKGEAKHKEAKQAKLMTKAKISKEAAQQTAMAKVPNGTIKEAEIEKEKGKLQWSVDMTTPDTKDITEVNVDAMTGDVISVEKESAESESKEAAGSKDKD
jgi:uncharacterized membrane protein YkoI